MILHEFLPQFVGQEMVNDILAHGRRFYKPSQEAYIPVEFMAAAYRFGHSMVRPSYRANLGRSNAMPAFPAFFGLIFNPLVSSDPDPADMSGGARAPRRFVDWQTFFDFGDRYTQYVKPNKRIDTHISTPLFNLPPGAIAGPSSPAVLPQRTLLRQLTWRLPSGQSIAQHMGVRVLSRTELQELSTFSLNFDEHTPLFYYILKEAEVIENGLHLGPVGGRIVGEVIIGLLQTDPASYLSIAPNWTPTLPVQRPVAGFRMTDFLRVAGVDPATRGQ
jgi:hypothetical protein